MAHSIDRDTKKYFNKRLEAMRSERSSFIGHYQDISRHIVPRRGRFFKQDRNKGDKRYQNIINSKATQAQRIARAGMFAGVMSPARPWFDLATQDPGLMEFQPVKVWLDEVTRTMRSIFNESNLYNMAPTMLGELVTFGTGCMTHVDDFTDVARFYTHTVGSYMIAQDDELRVDTIVREFEMTVVQLAEQFGLDKLSKNAKDMYDKGDYDKWVPVVQFIEPNPNKDVSKPGSQFKSWRSVTYEPNTDGTFAHDDKKFLSEKGFDQFPAYCPRWDLTGEDIYGTDCPGMTSLGDVKSLQVEEKRKAQAIDKMVNPPMSGPPSLRNVPVSGLPGGLTIYSGDPQGNKLEPLYTVNPQLNELMLDIQKVESRIDTAFYVDMFLAISNMDGIQPRNQEELLLRNEERLLQLGPVLERVHGELLSPLIDRVFAQMVSAELVPEAPEELQGAPLRVDFISSLAVAQKAVDTAGIDRLSAYVGGLAEAGFEQVIDKFNADQAIDEYAQLIGTPAKLIVPDNIVAKQREARAQQEQQARNAELAAQMAQVGQQAGQIDLTTDNPVTRVADAIDEGAGQ